MGEGHFNPSAQDFLSNSRVDYFITPVDFQDLLFHTNKLAFNMPLTNGDVSASPVRLLPGTGTKDFLSAVDFLKDGDLGRDGLDAKSLLDSHKNGGLAYNDFLILPGYIGIQCTSIWLETF